MKVCSKCLTLTGVNQLYCTTCKTLLTGQDKLDQYHMTTHKTGRLRTRPSKVYAGSMKMG
jgi:RNA polymerase subunit RPABC4/transcription elongation factor Spt4